MNGLLAGLLARRETGLIQEIEKLERRIIHMENQANKGMWIAGDDMRLSQYTANRKSENSEALEAVRILRCQGFSREQIEKEWKRQESQDKKSELVIEFIHILQNKGINFSIGGENIAVHGTLDLIGTSITSLPDNLSVDGGLYLCYTGISNLPDNLSVRGWLDLENTCITRLPNNLKVDGYLDLRCTGITSLPDNFSVGEGIDLRDTKIISLPNNLSVGHILCLQPENISNVAYRENCGKHNLTIFAARVNGGIRISADFSLNTLSDFEMIVDLKYLSKNAEDYKQAARECVAELEQRGEMAHYRLMKYCNIPLSEIPKAMRLLQKLMDVGYSAREIAKEALTEEARRAENKQVRVWHYEICNVSGNWHEDETPHKPDEEMFVVRNVRPVYFGEYTEPEKSTTWINVSDSLPELDTPVFGGWFSDNGNFFWGCYVRTRFANATDWVWATAEHFGEGEWLFDDDYPVEFWMPLPGKPDLVGGAA